MQDVGRKPIAASLWETVQAVMGAFDGVLAELGGSRPIWFVLLALKKEHHATQRGLAAAVGIQEATLTHHLTAMERDGLVTRHREAANRRVLKVALTEEGEKLFQTLHRAALAYDERLRSHFSVPEVEALTDMLGRLRQAASEADEPPSAPPLE